MQIHPLLPSWHRKRHWSKNAIDQRKVRLDGGHGGDVLDSLKPIVPNSRALRSVTFFTFDHFKIVLFVYAFLIVTVH